MSWLSAAATYAPYATGLLSAFQSFQGAGKSRQSGEQLAELYEEAGKREQRALRLAALRRRGVVRRGAAASGWDPNRGTPAEVVAENAYLDELDAQYAGFNANLRAQRARLDGDTAFTSGMYQGSSTILDLATRALRNIGPAPSPLSGGSVPAPSPSQGGLYPSQARTK